MQKSQLVLLAPHAICGVKVLYSQRWLAIGMDVEGWELLSLPPLAVPWTGLVDEVCTCRASPAGVAPGADGAPCVHTNNCT